MQSRRRLKLDVSEARTLSGFQSRVPFEVGLSNTITWYRRSAGQVEPTKSRLAQAA
ncbi:MAG: hypothetical protein R3264_07715 [Anaerolineae bacterium]|nr:hypothetical protein [Anaerolineae bacterium]